MTRNEPAHGRTIVPSTPRVSGRVRRGHVAARIFGLWLVAACAAADNAEAPPPVDPQQVQDWNRMVDYLNHGELGAARELLRDFVDRYGETAQTETLSRHLDAMGDRRPRKKDKGRRGW